MPVAITNPPAPLRDWLAGRSESERATLAHFWALEPGLARQPAQMADAMLRPEAVGRILAGLAERERSALALVQSYGGSIPAAILERSFGRVRQHGDYPNPRAFLLALEGPAEPTERLYLLALVQRAEGAGRGRYVIPPDLLALLPPVAARPLRLELPAAGNLTLAQAGDPAALERMILGLLELANNGQIELVPSGAVNKASMLRLVRRHDPQERLKGVSREEQWPFLHFARSLAAAAGLARAGADGLLRPTRAALEWMQLPAIERAGRLLEGWVEAAWDELSALYGVRTLAPLRRDLRAEKRALLRLVSQTPPARWVALDTLVTAVYQAEPDFARPEGDYERWQLRDRLGRSLDGFGHWEQVEGALLRAAVARSLHWLGLTDLGGERGEAYRLSPFGTSLLAGAPPPPEPTPERLVLQPNFEVVAPQGCSPYARFQLARIAERAGKGPTELFRLTRRSVHSALERGISAAELVAFFEQQSGRPLPQNVVATVQGWCGEYGQVSLRRVTLLEADSAAMLERIRHDRRVRMPSAAALGEAALLIPDGEAPGFAERLRKAGYGLDADLERSDSPLGEKELGTLLVALTFYDMACDLLGIDEPAGAALRRRMERRAGEHTATQAQRAAQSALRVLRKRLEGGDA